MHPPVQVHPGGPVERRRVLVRLLTRFGYSLRRIGADTEPLDTLTDDGLLTPEVGDWSETKYRHLTNYSEMFATATKGTWGIRNYLDLYAGAGRVRIENTDRILRGSPLIGLSVRDPFDHHIFCEADPERMEVLKTRVARDCSSASVDYVPGDVNDNVSGVLRKIPQHGPGVKVLSLCVVDPYRLSHLRFETIRRLSERFMDFFVLIPSAMDANRNRRRYLEEDEPALDLFFGATDWREAWEEWQKTHSAELGFDAFVTAEFGRQMSKLGYKDHGLETAVLNRSTEKNLPLYDLVVFSRNPLGDKLWKETMKYSTPQKKLFG